MISSARSRARTSTSASSGSRATRNSGRPCWRVPSTSPAPRSSRSISARRKPSRSFAIASSRGSLGSPKQDAERVVRAPAHPAAQLVQLREAVALGRLDQHHGGVRHVDPHLDHARGHQDVRLAGRETPPSRPPSPWRAAGRGSAARAGRGTRCCAGARTPPSPRAPGAPRTPPPAGRPRSTAGPAAISSRIRSYARARARAPSTTSVSTGRRPRGSSRSTVASRSP